MATDTKGQFSVDGELRDVLLNDVDDGCPICGVKTSHTHHVVINPASALQGQEGRLRPGSDEGAAGLEAKSESQSISLPRGTREPRR